MDVENTSGKGKLAIVPEDIKKWNWGAFLLSWIWGLSNRTYISLLTFVPAVGLAMPFILGAKGSEWAWRNKQWESVELFKRVQRKWSVAGVLVLVALPVLVALFAGGLLIFQDRTSP